MPSRKSNKGKMKKQQRKEDKLIKGFFDAEPLEYTNYITLLKNGNTNGVWHTRMKTDSDYLTESGFNQFIEENLNLTEFEIINVPIHSRSLLLEGNLYARCHKNSIKYSEENENWVYKTGFSVLKYKNTDKFMLEHHTLNYNTETGEYKDVSPDIDSTITNRLFIEEDRITTEDLTRFKIFQNNGFISQDRIVQFKTIQSDTGMSMNSIQARNHTGRCYSYTELLELKERTQHIQLIEM